MIEGVSGRRPVLPDGRTRIRTGGETFRIERDMAVDAAAAPLETAAALAVGGMLVLQEAESEDRPDRRARQRGQDLLRALGALQRDLLAGDVDPAKLQTLGALLDQVPPADDPALRDTMRALVLRARIEMWRHGGASAL